MLKKLTLASVVTLSLLLSAAQAEGMKCQAGKCASAKAEKSGKKCNKKKSCDKGKSCAKGKKGSPLLIARGLPALMRVVERHGDDAKLALTAEQKTKLNAQRDDMMPKMMNFKSEIATLKKDIVKASRAGTKVGDLKAKVEKLGTLETDATLLKLTCISGVQTILSTEQLTRLRELKKEDRVARKMKKAMKKAKSMKCAAGKCGAK